MRHMQVLAAIISTCVGHMILQYPKPYGATTLNNSPLEKSGQDFPCKQRQGVYDLVQMNYWKVGEVQTVSFTGTAVHGGGSCQFSITTDLQPSKDSQWKVIHSVIGGCPASADGNLSPGKDAATFDITLPEDLPGGRYTFAWTWFNRRGSREMYMNCAPISVSSNSNDTAFFDKLPNMFVANLPSSDCATVEEYDYAFPQPGDSVTTAQQANITTMLLGLGCASMTKLGGGAGSMSSPEAVVLGDLSDAVHTPTILNTDVTKPARETILSSMSSSETAAISMAMVYNLVSNNEDLYPQSRTLTSHAPLPTCIPCVTDGHVVCIDEDYFGICDNGCAFPQALATGTSCSNGLIIRRSA